MDQILALRPAAGTQAIDQEAESIGPDGVCSSALVADLNEGSLKAAGNQPHAISQANSMNQLVSVELLKPESAQPGLRKSAGLDDVPSTAKMVGRKDETMLNMVTKSVNEGILQPQGSFKIAGSHTQLETLNKPRSSVG